MIRPVSYLGMIERIEVERNVNAITERLEMLRSYGFTCKLERHCGFWLIHWSFPKIRLVESGHALRVK